MNRCKINSFFFEVRKAGAIILGELAFGNELFGTDKQGVASESRVAGIRRIAISGWAKRQHLPQALPCGLKKVRECIRLRSEIADAVSSGQRSWVKQDAAGSGKVH